MHVEQVTYTDRDLYDFLSGQESQFVEWGNVYEDQVLDRVKNGQTITGARLPWAGTWDKIRLKPGQVSIIAGMNGHMKSMALGQILMWVALQDNEPIGVASFEMPVIDTQERMLWQAAGTAQPSEQFARYWSRWTENRICFYDKLDTTPAEKVLGAIYHMAKDKGCKHIMIDSLTKCGLPYGERGAEKAFIDALCATAKAFGIHIYLVCHVRKPATGGEEHIPTKFDVRGAGELTDLVHNVFICWNDKKKKSLLEAQDKGATLSPKESDYLQRPDQRLIVVKQRNGSYEGTIGLWKLPCLQFTERPGKILPFNVQGEGYGP